MAHKVHMINKACANNGIELIHNTFVVHENRRNLPLTHNETVCAGRVGHYKHPDPVLRTLREGSAVLGHDRHIVGYQIPTLHTLGNERGTERGV